MCFLCGNMNPILSNIVATIEKILTPRIIFSSFEDDIEICIINAINKIIDYPIIIFSNSNDLGFLAQPAKGIARKTTAEIMKGKGI